MFSITFAKDFQKSFLERKSSCQKRFMKVIIISHLLRKAQHSFDCLVRQLSSIRDKCPSYAFFTVLSCCMIVFTNCNLFLINFLVVQCLNRCFKHCTLCKRVIVRLHCIVYIQNNGREMHLHQGCASCVVGCYKGRDHFVRFKIGS